MSRAAATILTLSVVVAALAVASYWHWSSRAPEARPLAPAGRSASARSASPAGIVDPIAPQRFVALDSTARGGASGWLEARPGFQYSHTAAERGGVEPCVTQKVDTSAFEDWQPLSKAGERILFVSHSSIDPPSFASTTECAHYLIASVQG